MMVSTLDMSKPTYSTDSKVTKAVDDMCMSLPNSPQTPSAPIDGRMQMEAQPQAYVAGCYPTEATGLSPDPNLHDTWFSGDPRAAQSPSRERPAHRSSRWHSSAACLPQEVMYSVENGTVDPKALALRS